MKKAIAAAILASTLSTGCLGPNNLQNSFNNWNATMTDMNWVNEVFFFFIGSWVQGICLMVDHLVFNTIDYWSGENPIGTPGPFPESFSN